VALVVGLVAVLAVVGLVVAAIVGRSGSGPCRLDAIAEVIDRNAPALRGANKASTDVIGIRSRDSEVWTDVVLAVYGFETTAATRKAAGRFEHRIDNIEAGGFGAANLNDFQQSDGRRWSSLTMQASEVEIAAKRLGAPCIGSVSLE
jgi:hypothetical protein